MLECVVLKTVNTPWTRVSPGGCDQTMAKIKSGLLIFMWGYPTSTNRFFRLSVCMSTPFWTTSRQSQHISPKWCIRQIWDMVILIYLRTSTSVPLKI